MHPRAGVRGHNFFRQHQTQVHAGSQRVEYTLSASMHAITRVEGFGTTRPAKRVHVPWTADVDLVPPRAPRYAKPNDFYHRRIALGVALSVSIMDGNPRAERFISQRRIVNQIHTLSVLFTGSLSLSRAGVGVFRFRLAAPPGYFFRCLNRIKHRSNILFRSSGHFGSWSQYVRP